MIVTILKVNPLKLLYYAGWIQSVTTLEQLFREYLWTIGR